MGGSLLLLLDDIASVLDDVATMTKLAAKKTAGVLGDDLALNAKQVTGVEPDRELPVVWAVARGSAINKAILVPGALVISWLAPWAIGPLLVLGGGFLCYEGVEKVLHKLLHTSHTPDGDEDAGRPSGGAASVAGTAEEQRKISAAIRTDFILSAEIIVITLGVVAARPLVTRVGVLVAISVAMTVGVYGLVAGIVKLDDLGLRLAGSSSRIGRTTGLAILAAAPWLMRALSVAGTAAMFLVGGGIIAHALPAVEHALADAAAAAAGGSDEPLAGLLVMAANAFVGAVAGLAVVGVVTMAARLRGLVAG